MINDLVLTNEQQARALRAIRCDRVRELNTELSEINNEIDVIDRYIESCYNDKQGDLFRPTPLTPPIPPKSRLVRDNSSGNSVDTILPPQSLEW